jgi:hypothetical protein
LAGRLAARLVRLLSNVPRAMSTLMLATCFCALVSACSDDSKAPDSDASNADSSATSQDQNNIPVLAQQPGIAPAAMPAHTIQTPPPSASQLGAAAPASDSLAPPVIHTVD